MISDPAVLARGEGVAAGPVLRLQRALLLWLSRLWQIESPYRANAKYHPAWVPRFICSGGRPTCRG